MNDVSLKVNYLKGLLEGLDVKEDSKEGKVYTAITNILEEIADEISELQVSQDELEDYIESIDEDLQILEEEVYEENECCCTDEDELDDEDYIEVVCPDCGDTVCFEADILNDEDLIEVTCPNCDAVVFVNDEDVEQAEELNDDEDEEK